MEDRVKVLCDKLINDELPELFATGFINAMKKYKKDRLNENTISCILNIDNKAKMFFAYGNIENINNELIFYEFRSRYISDMLKGSKEIIAIFTDDLAKEYTRSLKLAVKLAEEQKAFENTKITIYGKLIMYGHIKSYETYNIDITEVIYENNK